MHTDWHQHVQSANRRVRRVRRSTGRILAVALGFGIAHYFDPENGDARRRRLAASVRRAARVVDSRLASEAGDPPPALLPLLRALHPHHEDSVGVERGRVQVVAH
jgi:hypothetical protein